MIDEMMVPLDYFLTNVAGFCFALGTLSSAWPIDGAYDNLVASRILDVGLLAFRAFPDQSLRHCVFDRMPLVLF